MSLGVTIQNLKCEICWYSFSENQIYDSSRVDSHLNKISLQEIYLYIHPFNANQCQMKNKSFATKINASVAILKRSKNDWTRKFNF